MFNLREVAPGEDLGKELCGLRVQSAGVKSTTARLFEEGN